MHSRLILDVSFTARQIERLKEQYPELAEDAELLADTIAGETEFEPVIERVTDEFLDAVAMKEAIASRMSALRERGDRYDRKADAMKGLALGMMEAANVPKVSLPAATLSIRKGGTSVVIDDAAELPQGFVRYEPTPLNAEIKAALQAGDAIPGARLQTGADSLAIRTK